MAFPYSNPLAGRLDAVADALGVNLGKQSKARKHGFRPQARRHVERFLLRTVVGVRAEDMARAEGYSRANIFRSIQIGRELARSNAGRLGWTAEDVAGRALDGPDD